MITTAPINKSMSRGNTALQVVNNNQDQNLTENELFKNLRVLHLNISANILVGYWLIGNKINTFYKKEYGSNKLKKISREVGIQLGTLQKACQFALKYSKEDVVILIDGNFTMSWSMITKYLAITPRKLIGVYKISTTKKEFNNSIIKFKNHGEIRGRSGKQIQSNSELNRISKRLHEQNLKYIKLRKQLKSEKEKRNITEERLKIEKSLNKNLRSDNRILQKDIKLSNWTFKFYYSMRHPSGKKRKKELTYDTFNSDLPSLEPEIEARINPGKSSEHPDVFHILIGDS